MDDVKIHFNTGFKIGNTKYAIAKCKGDGKFTLVSDSYQLYHFEIVNNSTRQDLIDWMNKQND